jgi:hypothetical protein
MGLAESNESSSVLANYVCANAGKRVMAYPHLDVDDDLRRGKLLLYVPVGSTRRLPVKISRSPSTVCLNSYTGDCWRIFPYRPRAQHKCQLQLMAATLARTYMYSPLPFGPSSIRFPLSIVRPKKPPERPSMTVLLHCQSFLINGRVWRYMERLRLC